MVICGTGHRPDKLGGYGEEVFGRLVNLAWDLIDDIRPRIVISGMALGWDQALAQAALNAGVELHAYCPCYEQDSKWPPKSRAYFRELMDKAAEVHYSVEGRYSGPSCMQKRNEDMVNASDVVLALWNGSSGGTGNCIAFAEKENKTIINVWNLWAAK